jgi:hypothetical protein
MRLPSVGYFAVGRLFLTTAMAAFMATVAILAGAGYAIVEITQSAGRAITHTPTDQPRDLFRTGSFEFNLASGWWCELEGSEYVCDPPGKPPYAAIAIIAIKERGADDNLNAYENHLQQPRRLDGKAGSDAMSVVSWIKRVKLGNEEWVEALHLGSEVPNYDTYYLATTTSHLGILVTMSVHRDRRGVYVGQLTQMMSSLNVYQK